MKPHLVKKIKDTKTGEVTKIKPEVVRRTVSKKTSEEMRGIMEYAVNEGGGKTAAVKGYRVGGKTGTANKAVNGGYSNFTYSSCLSMAPMSDPKLTALVVVDSPRGVHYGSVTAGPVVKEIMEKSLKYLNIPPDGTEETEESEDIEVPDVVGMTTEDAISLLAGAGLDYDMNDKDDFVVVKQYPAAGSVVKEGTKVFLYKE